MTKSDGLWRVPDERLAAGLVPGYVGAVRIGGSVETRVAGHLATDEGSAPMGADTLFRIASLTKVIGAVLAMSLIADGIVSLDDPVDKWLPEAAHPRVLVDRSGPLDQTVEAREPITLRHLLTMTAGWGVVFDQTPLQRAMIEREVFPGPLTPPISGDEFVARVADLPLAFQPGDGWMYDTCIDIAGVVMARAAGAPLSDLIAERITGPLGMTSTSFWTPDIGRLATAYQPAGDGLEVLDPPDGMFSHPPTFEELSSGLVSTAGDLLTFFCAMADGGGPVLTPESVATMTADALNESQRQSGAPILADGQSWGLGTGVDCAAVEPWMAVGRWGWEGGTGTTAHVDPSRGTIGVLVTQRAMMGPQDGWNDFWADVAHAARQ